MTADFAPWIAIIVAACIIAAVAAAFGTSTATGIGAALSTTLAGYAIDHFGSSVAFFSLAFIAACGLALVWLLLPETRETSLIVED